MNTSTILFAVACFQVASPSAIDVATEDQQSPRVNDSMDKEFQHIDVDVEMSTEEKWKKMRIEIFKFQILSKVDLKDVPPSVEPPSEASKEVIRLMMKEDEEMQHQQHQLFDSEERLVFQAKGNGMPCLQSNESYCKMFLYQLSTTLNTSSLDIWIYKLTEFPRWISIALAFSNSYEEKYYDYLYYELSQVGWNKLQLPRILLPPSWNDSVFYSVEIIGQNIEDRGDHRPFLMVSKLFPVPSRQRRDVTCDTNDSCCLKPLKVTFAEIGFNWVVYPEEVDANICLGKCRMDQSSLRTHYERALTKVLDVNTTLNASLGECWILCCKPKTLVPVKIFYYDTNGTIHEQSITELIVTSCSCS